MDPVDALPTRRLARPPFSTQRYKIRCHKEVRFWTVDVHVCADGGYGREKGTLAALGLLIYMPLPPARQKLVAKAIGTIENILNPSNADYTTGVMEFSEQPTKIVGKDSVLLALKGLAKHIKAAT